MATATTAPQTTGREFMNLVVVGHVDHGKSTVIGRLMADTGSLPEGKLEQVKAMCARNARPFEYAFLLDALKNEQAQGITIDTARCFFKTARRNYIINDAPGHIEFLKNMITGAARAEAALLVIDAAEGIQENSKRHGYMVSMLGVHQLAVLVNKMDLAEYSEAAFAKIREEYMDFLGRLDVHPAAFIPLAAREGENIAKRSEHMPWYTGPTVLELVDRFERLGTAADDEFRMPVQDIYKFTEGGDDRRIIAGTIESGTIRVGDPVIFYPSGKSSTVKSIEGFNAAPRDAISAPYAAGLTLAQQIYIKPGEMMCRHDRKPPHVGRRFRANMFWMGRVPMVKGKSYRLKLGSARVNAQLAEVLSVLDASELSSVVGKQQIDRHDVAECVIEAAHPIAFDRRNELEATGRFVIVDDFEIAGAGVILEPMDEHASLLKEEVLRREFTWEKGLVTPAERAKRNNHVGKFVVFVGRFRSGKRKLAREVERHLFERGCKTYYFGLTNLVGAFDALDKDQHVLPLEHDDAVERLGDLARVMTDAGMLFLTCLTDVDDFDMEKLRLLNQPNEVFVVTLGEIPFSRFAPDLALPENPEMESAVRQVVRALMDKQVLVDFSI